LIEGWKRPLQWFHLGGIRAEIHDRRNWVRGENPRGMDVRRGPIADSNETKEAAN
jgi:hypothetical protein